MKTRTILFSMLLLVSLHAQAEVLCTGLSCQATFEFATGGSLETDSGATLTFGEGALLDLGDGGSVELGQGGELSSDDLLDLLAAGDALAGSFLMLGQFGVIHFGAGGLLVLGTGGNIETDPTSTTSVVSASSVRIDTDGYVNVGRLDSQGDIFLVSDANITGVSGSSDAISLNVSDPNGGIKVSASLDITFRENIHSESDIYLTVPYDYDPQSSLITLGTPMSAAGSLILDTGTPMLSEPAFTASSGVISISGSGI